MSEPTDEDNDDDLEHSEEEIKSHFEAFWLDVVPEFRKFGKIEQLRVCRNHSHHLRGNVYVMYKREEDARRAFQAFQGRFYAGRQLFVQYSPLVNWKTAVCGLFKKLRCERGKQCNFLHVFKNPNGELEGKEEEEESRDRRDVRRDDKRETRETRETRDTRDRPRDKPRAPRTDRDRRESRDDRREGARGRDSHDHREREPRDEDRKRKRSRSGSGSPAASRSPSPDAKRARPVEVNQ